MQTLQPVRRCILSARQGSTRQSLAKPCAGPSLKFYCDSAVALAGAEFKAELDGEPVPFWTSVHVKAGAVLTVGTVGLSFPSTAKLQRVACC